MHSSDRPRDAVSFAQLLLPIIDEGRRTATYKLALLMAIIDCCSVSVEPGGRISSRIPARRLAARVLELYWPQVRLHPAAGNQQVLRQSTQARSVTVDAVAALHARALKNRLRSPFEVERFLPEAYAKALDTIEHNLVTMPLGKLQRPADYSSAVPYVRFMYDDTAFVEGLTRAQVRTRAYAVELHEGVGSWLVSLAPLLRPLIELHWTREVARRNQVAFPEDRLRDFMFGASRLPLRRLAPGLTELQQGRCFYCRAKLVAGLVEVDHFVPWSRMANDGLANLVLADRRCNSSKSDYLASLSHLERWADRPADLLRQLADDARWPLREDGSRRLAAGIYARLPVGTPLWAGPGAFDIAGPQTSHSALSRLDLNDQPSEGPIL